MPSFTTHQDRQVVSVKTAEVELAFSLDDGGLRTLRRLNRPNTIGYGSTRPSVDLQVGVDGRWLSERLFVRYLDHMIDERDGNVEVTIVIGIGPLMAYDHYRITGTLIARRVTVMNVGEDEILLRAVRLALPWARVGDLETCRFEAPGNSVRPHVPLHVAAALRRGVLPRRFFAPGLREGRAFEDVPTLAIGLMAIHDPLSVESLFCWYYSDEEPAQPQIEGNDTAVTLIHEVELADRLRTGVALAGGTQYILLLHEAWTSALTAFRRTMHLIGLRQLTDPAPWIRDAALYEVHPAQFGGFQGLTTALGDLNTLGINTLCLLPIWAFHNRKGRLWDNNWIDTGNPYAVLDFEVFDPTLGTADDFQQLIETAHELGIRVLVDLPLVGCDIHARYVTEQPSWFCWDPEGQMYTRPNEPDMYFFDWANSELQRYILNQARELACTYNLDGYRVIVPRHPMPNWAPNTERHASAGSLAVLRLLDQLRRGLKATNPDAVLLSPFSGPIYQSRVDFACDELSHHHFFHAALNRMTPAELGEWLRDHSSVQPFDIARVCFTESYNTRLLNPLADGLRGSLISRMLFAGLVFCGFIPMLRCGQERGDEQFVEQLLHARQTHAVLRYGETNYNRVPSDSAQVFAVLRKSNDQSLLGLLNFSPHKRTVTFRLPIDLLGLTEGDYVLSDVLQNTLWNEEGQRSWHHDQLIALRLTLEPFSAHCLLVLPLSLDEASVDQQQPDPVETLPERPVAVEVNE